MFQHLKPGSMWFSTALVSIATETCGWVGVGGGGGAGQEGGVQYNEDGHNQGRCARHAVGQSTGQSTGCAPHAAGVTQPEMAPGRADRAVPALVFFKKHVPVALVPS